MRLFDLLKDFSGVAHAADLHREIDITGLTTDPEMCRPGSLYVAAVSETVDGARFGVRLDGRDHIAQAVRNGAVAVLTDPQTTLPPLPGSPVVLITHDEPLRLLGPMCRRFLCDPQPRHIALVTGTNGKTSTVTFCRELWRLAGMASCSIGTLGGICSDGSLIWDRGECSLTVPETVSLHGMLTTLARRGFDHVAMEATSHALFYRRLDGVAASIGAFTNLTWDHLEFHVTMEEYFRAKMILFSEVLPPGSTSILNADASWYERVRQICDQRKHRVVSYGRNGSDIRLVDFSRRATGQLLTIDVFGERYVCELNLFGEFQASNVLCSLGIVIASGLPADRAVPLIPMLTEVEGRLTIVAVTPSGGRVVVDFAHTPDGLQVALEACRSFTEGKLAVLFGSIGNSQKSKRVEMGEIASRLADEVIITDDQPMFEDPAQIRQHLLEGAPTAREVENRARAVEIGIRELRSGDTLLLAGLGHEKAICVRDTRIPYSDTETALRVVSMLRSQPGLP